MILKKIDQYSQEELFMFLRKQFEKWEQEVLSAEPLFKIDGKSLEELARLIPQQQVYYAQLSQNARAIVKWLENERAQKESRHIKNYNSAPRALGIKEQTMYVQGEKDVVALNQFIIEATLFQQHFTEITEAIKQMAWMLSNIVKLRVAEIQDAIV